MSTPEFIVFVGPMFGSKTTSLLAVVDRYRYQNKHIIAFKPKLDTRYSVGKIVTHNGGQIDAHTVSKGEDVLEIINSIKVDLDVVAVDEAFMIDGISSVLITLFKKGITIVLSSLELSASCTPFSEIISILPWATKIQKCPAVCPLCGRDAYYTHRKIDSLDEIAVGGSELYEPRCWYHHSLINLKREYTHD